MKTILKSLWRRPSESASSKPNRNDVVADPARKQDHKELYKAFAPFTMINEAKYIDTLALISDWASNRNAHGSVVECGCWRGGMIAGIARLLGKIGTYHLFDSFEGLPEAQPIDEARAKDWQTDTMGPQYHNNCKAEQEEAETAMSMTTVEWRIHPGWFQDTFPESDIDNICLLRLDGDWYDSTMLSLKTFFPKLQEGGILLIDDYYIWEGCCRAVHDYLSQTQSTSRLQSRNQVCYLIKTEECNELIHTP